MGLTRCSAADTDREAGPYAQEEQGIIADIAALASALADGETGAEAPVLKLPCPRREPTLPG